MPVQGADQASPTLQRLGGLYDCNEEGENFTIGHDTPEICYDRMADFWRAFEVVTGEKLKQSSDPAKAQFFSCAC